MKKIARTILIVLMICAMIPITALAASEVGGRDGNIEWKIKGTTLTISPVPGTNGKMNDFDDYDYAPWYKVNGNKSYEIITDIVIEDGVSRIGNHAFCYFSKVKKLGLPDSCSIIGHEAFYKCEGLKEVSLCGDVREDAFVYCSKLRRLVINEGCYLIEQEAFSECYALEYLALPSSLHKIECEAFEYDTNLKLIKYFGTKDKFSNIIIVDDDNEPIFEAINGQNGRKVAYKTTKKYTYFDVNGNPATVDGSKEDCWILNDCMPELEGGWYIVDSKLDFGSKRIYVKEDSNILLLDNCGIDTSGGIGVANTTLRIYSESLDEDTMGYINVLNSSYEDAGIGSGNKGNGTVKIAGGIISTNGNHAPGIGSGVEAECTIEISGGIIEANCGTHAAGIGSGYSGDCKVTITGGTVTAYGEEAGIGSGEGIGLREEGRASVWIKGGTVTAYGGNGGAGIGSGSRDSKCAVYILGGTIIAEGGECAAGIGTGKGPGNGCSLFISGGTIKATGKDGADDIGCGVGNNSCHLEDKRSTASILSEGYQGIVVGIAVLSIGFLIAMYNFRKKKAAVSSMVEKGEE